MPPRFSHPLHLPQKHICAMKNFLRTTSFLLVALGFVPAVFAQIPGDCGGPPADVPPAESCLEACVYCDFTGFQGTTEGYMANTAPPGFCGSLQNDQWVSFVAGSPAPTFTLTPSNCLNGNGLEFALYESCSTPPLICKPGQMGGGTTPLIITANNLTVGRHYYLMIDGYAGDQCSFNLTVGPPMAGLPPSLGNISPIQGPPKVCPGAIVTYEVPQVSGAGFYTWTSTTSEVRFNGESSPADFLAPEGRKVAVTFPVGITGNVNICVQASNACNNGPKRCLTINTQPIPPTNLPPIVKCSEDSLPPGPHITKIILKSWLGCDSVIQQKVTVKPLIQTNIGNKFICAGGAFTICGKEIKETGPIMEVCQSYQGCDSVVTGFVNILNPQFKVTLPPRLMLSCLQPEITLSIDSISPMAIVIWRKNASMVAGVGKVLKVSKSGKYSATATISLGGTTCVFQRNFVVSENFTQPASIKISRSGSLASGGSVELKAYSPTPDLLYQWIGPQGFISVSQVVQVMIPGTYKVTAMHPISGCTTMREVEVK